MGTSKNDAPTTPRRRWRRALLLLVVAIVLIAGLIVGFLPSIISSNLPGWISSAIANDVDAAVEVDRSSFSWGGEQSIEGLRLKERRPDGTSRTVLSVGRAVIKNSLLDIVGGGSRPLTIEIDEPLVEAHRDADGSNNWARILDVDGGGGSDPGSESRPVSRESQPAPEADPAGRSDPVSWTIERELIVKVRNGRVRYRDDVLSTTSELESATAVLEIGRESAKAELSARVVQPDAGTATSGTATPGTAASGTATSATAPPGKLRFSGTVTGLAPSFHPGELAAKAEGVISSLDLRPYVGLLAELEAKAPAEPVNGRFTIEMRGGKLFSEVDLDAAFLSLLDPRLPEGLELGENAHASITELVMDAGLEEGRGAVELTGSLRYQGYRVSRLAAKVEIKKRRLLFSDVNADLNGGRLIAPRLSLDLTGDKPEYELELGLEDVEANQDMSPLLAYVVPFLALEDRQGSLSGKITASLKVQGRGLEVADLDALVGTGEFRLRDGQFQGSRFFREVARLVGTDLDRVAFSELGSDFRFSLGSIASDNVFLTETSDKLRNLGLKGTTTLRGEIDYGVDLAALQATVGDRGIRDVLKGVSAVLGKDGVPIRLGGTLKAPKLTWGASPKQKGKTEKGAGGLLDKIFRQ